MNQLERTYHESSDSDEDVLQAVIDFLDTFDAEHKSEKAVRSQDRPHKRTTRHSSERVKDEIRDLRDLAVQLEDRVAELQHRRATMRVTSPSGQQWELLAQQEKDHRIQAEVENLQLRALLEKQSQVAKRLERLLLRGHLALDNNTNIDAILCDADEATPEC